MLFKTFFLNTYSEPSLTTDKNIDNVCDKLKETDVIFHWKIVVIFQFNLPEQNH